MVAATVLTPRADARGPNGTRGSRAAPRALALVSTAALGAALGVVLGSIPGATLAQGLPEEGRWYAGAGAGVARLTPDTEASTLELDGDTAGAVGAWVGRDLTRRIALEATVAALGEAELSNGSTIGYRAVAGGVVAHVLGTPRGPVPSMYLRAGLGVIDNDSDLEIEQADAVSLWAGAGVEWSFARRWALRGELASYDGDAQAGFLTLFRRFGTPGTPARLADAGEAREADEAVVATAAPAPRPSAARLAPTPVRRPDLVEPDLAVNGGSAEGETGASVAEPLVPAPLPGEAPPEDCPAPGPGEPADAFGCARFSGTLAGVGFEPGTAVPTPTASRLLERLAGELVEEPELALEIHAHTDAALGEAGAQALSRERAVAVARALIDGGVDVSRLNARAFGASRPRADEAEPGGQRLNNRIELRVRP